MNPNTPKSLSYDILINNPEYGCQFFMWTDSMVIACDYARHLVDQANGADKLIAQKASLILELISKCYKSSEKPKAGMAVFVYLAGIMRVPFLDGLN